MKFANGTLSFLRNKRRIRMRRCCRWAVVAACVWAMAPTPGFGITVLTEELPPLSTLVSGRAEGFSVEVVQEILSRLSEETPIRFQPWSRAYKTALTTQDVALFTVTRLPERENRFHWIGPLLVAHNGFYALRENDIQIDSLEDARGVRAIATYRDDAREQMLTGLGFTNLDRADSPDACLKKLAGGRVPLWLGDSLTLPAVARRNGLSSDLFKLAFSFRSADLYIALSKDTPVSTAAKWQQTLDALKADGSFTAMAKKWLPTESIPKWVVSPSVFGYPRPTLKLYTEDSPPGNYIEDGEIKGFSVAVVREIFRRLAMPDTITVVPWARGYHMAQNDPAAGVFSTTRLPQREGMFNWVGPLYRQQWGLYARKDRGLVIADMAAAKRVDRIGTYLEDAKALYLKDLGFTNLVNATAISVNIRHLLDGRIDLWASSDFNMPYQMRQAGASPDLLQNVFTFKAVENFIAFHKDMPENVVAAWQQTLDDIKAEGRYDRLYNSLVRFQKKPSQ